MKITRNMYVENTQESRELELYAKGDFITYTYHIRPVIANLHNKYVKGTFDGAKGIIAFYHATTTASDSYFKNYGHKFSVTERWTAAHNLLHEYLGEITKA